MFTPRFRKLERPKVSPLEILLEEKDRTPFLNVAVTSQPSVQMTLLTTTFPCAQERHTWIGLKLRTDIETGRGEVSHAVPLRARLFPRQRVLAQTGPRPLHSIPI